MPKYRQNFSYLCRLFLFTLLGPINTHQLNTVLRGIGAYFTLIGQSRWRGTLARVLFDHKQSLLDDNRALSS